MTSEVRLRLSAPADRAGIGFLLRLAFGGPDEAELVEGLTRGTAYLPDLELVAEEDGVLVGYLLFTRARIEEVLPGMMTRSVPAISLGPLAVRPDRQGQGLGAELVREGLDRARMLGEGIALVMGHPDYYARLGFHEAARYGIAPPREADSSAWMVAELVPGALDDVRGRAVLAAIFDTPPCW